jgi:integrase
VEIRKRVRNGKVSWLARHYDPDGRRVSRTFPRQIDAVRWATGIENSKLTGTYTDPGRGRMKTADFADEWLKAQSHLKPSTRVKYEGILDKHVRPRFGTTPLAKITHTDVTEWVGGLSHLAPGSVRYIHRVLYLIMELAVRDGRIVKNPAAGVRLPKLPKAAKNYLTRDQVWRLADAAAAYPIPEVGAQYRALILLLAFTGLRWSEAAGLKVKRLDLLRRRVVVAEALGEVQGRLVWGTPKNHQAREVSMPAFLVDELAQVVAGKGQDDLVFTTWRGRPLRNLNFRRDVFDKAASDAGLAGVTPHELRHTAASLAVSAGADVKAVQEMLGHASATLTLDTYTHLFNDRLQGVADRLDEAHRAAGGHPVGTRSGGADVLQFKKSS